ncbi:aldose 1-epimerase family protein [Novosphingobium tardum]|uniref:Aldose 1-epimerase family protein n=1 Tax=Novosphingobium tardum TaxID=1538021 RepID=A0ABV8RKK3_9SPHN
MTDFVTIRSDGLTAQLNPIGAELWSLRDQRGDEWMTDADPAYWTGHAPLLFPIVGALNGGVYRTGGERYAMPKHGFARTSTFEVVRAEPGRATFRLADDARIREVYPFAFVLDVDYALAGMVLTVTATVANPGSVALPFSFGFHPAFAWPLPGGAAKDAHRVTFERPEPHPISRLDPASGLLLPEGEYSPVEGDTLFPEAPLFEADALIWDRLNSRAVRFGAPGGGAVEFAFPDMPTLGIWQKPGAAYLCIEPWQGIADPVGFAGDISAKPGIVLLSPGAERSFRLDIAIRPV